jgi:hypothetical protein
MSAGVDRTWAPRARDWRREAVALGRTPAVREAWGALWRSRLLIWIVAAAAMLIYGLNVANRVTFDPANISHSFGGLGNVLVAPAVRWDAVWYVWISEHGYRSLQSTGFFPLYPLLTHVVSWLTAGSTVIAGIVISLLATFIGLVVVHRLTELELGPRAASTTVKLIAFGPFAFYLSAVYTEGLFLALSAGTFLAARRQRWALAGLLGGLAAMTRVTGLLLIVPVAMLWLADQRGRWHRPAPRNLLWALLIPAGAAAFGLYTAARGYGFFASPHAQHLYWQHRFTGPISAIVDGVRAAWHQLSALVSGSLTDATRGSAVLQVVVLAVACVAIVGIARRLPPAYAAYVVLGLLVPLSSPTVGDPLRGLDRYASMMFPLFMWLGTWSFERRLNRPLLALSVVLLAAFTVQFATWHVVGSIPT